MAGCESDTWNALTAPPKTPAGVVAKLNDAANQAMKDPELLERYKQAQPGARRRHARADGAISSKQRRCAGAQSSKLPVFSRNSRDRGRGVCPAHRYDDYINFAHALLRPHEPRRIDTLPLAPGRRADTIMRKALFGLFNDRDAELGGKIAGIYGLLIAANVLAWVWALIAFRDYPVLLGTAFLAYTFGLRHAVDADHIAAIDNVTRKLMQEGKRPIGVGFFFSLGHSTVVVLASAGDRARPPARSQGRFDGVQARRRHRSARWSRRFSCFSSPPPISSFCCRSIAPSSEVRRGGAYRRGRPRSSAGAARPARPRCSGRCSG